MPIIIIIIIIDTFATRFVVKLCLLLLLTLNRSFKAHS